MMCKRNKKLLLAKLAIFILLAGFSFGLSVEDAFADLLPVNPVFDITGSTYIFKDPISNPPFITETGILQVGHFYLGDNSVWNAAAFEFSLPIPKSSIDYAEVYIPAASWSSGLSFGVSLYGYAGNGTPEFGDTEVAGKESLGTHTGVPSISYEVTAFIKNLSGDNAGFTLAMLDSPSGVDQSINYYSLEVTGSPPRMPTLYLYYTPAPIPLPGAVWLFGSGLLGLGALGWRRRRKD